MEFVATCPHCQKLTESSGDKPTCLQCKGNLFQHASESFLSGETWDQCPICGCAHLYRQKDFNRKIGMGLIIVGVLLAYWTYGVSILVVTLLDFWIAKKVGEVGCCYQCKTVYRNTSQITGLPPFNLQLHDYYRSLQQPFPAPHT